MSWLDDLKTEREKNGAWQDWQVNILLEKIEAMQWQDIKTCPRHTYDDDWPEDIILYRASNNCIRQGFWLEREDGSGYWTTGQQSRSGQEEPDNFPSPSHWIRLIPPEQPAPQAGVGGEA